MQQTNLPSSYSSNTAKEETLLEYVEDFRRQFVSLFPARPPLYLSPRNECGVRKFICTTIRPTLLPYPEVHGLQACALFVADFLEYLTLDVPTEYSDVVPSPTTVAASRAGDCVDFSIFLCSLLRGAGYDAYVALGTAPKHITQFDLTETDCPLLNNLPDFDGGNIDDKWWDFDKYKTSTRNTAHKEFDKLKIGGGGTLFAASSKPSSSSSSTSSSTSAGPQRGGTARGGGTARSGSAGPEGGGDSKQDSSSSSTSSSIYEIIEPPVHRSEFIEALEYERKAMQALRTRDAEAAAQAKMKKPVDPLRGSRVHAWVVVRSGRRGVSEHVFVEPSTGTIYPVAHSPYQSLESVFNESNYWVNIQSEIPLSDLSYDLRDSNTWEYVIIENSNNEASDDFLSSTGSLSSSSSSSSSRGDDSSSGVGGGVRHPRSVIGRRPTSRPADAMASYPSFSSSSSSSTSTSSSSSMGSTVGDQRQQQQQRLEVFDIPLSWVSKLTIDRKTFANRYPALKKVQYYRDCIVEKYCPFHKEHQGLVLQLSIFEPGTGPVLSLQDSNYAHEVRSYFKNREDKLLSRFRYTLTERVHEKYDQGRDGGLMEYVQVANKHRLFKFYPNSRVDGMVIRMEAIGSKVVEMYEGCQDAICYRSISVDPTQQASRATRRDNRLETIALGRGNELPIRKITEKFERNPNIPAEKDIRKRTHFLLDNLIRIDYHYNPGFVTHSVQMIDKLDKSHAPLPPVLAGIGASAKVLTGIGISANLPTLGSSSLTSSLLAGGSGSGSTSGAGGSGSGVDTVSALVASAINGVSGSAAASSSNVSSMTGLGAGASDKVGGGGAGGANKGVVSRSFEHRVLADYKLPSEGERRGFIDKILQRERWLISTCRQREFRLTEMIQRLDHENHDSALYKSIYVQAQEIPIDAPENDGNDLQYVSVKKTAAELASINKDGDTHGSDVRVFASDDILGPFTVDWPSNPTLRQMQLAHDACMEALKERLIARAEVIRRHLEVENNKLANWQANAKRAAGGASELEEEARTSKQVEQIIFRIEVLRQRQQEHHTASLAKFDALERKLQAHPKLAPLYQAQQAQGGAGNSGSASGAGVGQA